MQASHKFNFLMSVMENNRNSDPLNEPTNKTVFVCFPNGMIIQKYPTTRRRASLRDRPYPQFGSSGSFNQRPQPSSSENRSDIHFNAGGIPSVNRRRMSNQAETKKRDKIKVEKENIYDVD